MIFIVKRTSSPWSLSSASSNVDSLDRSSCTGQRRVLDSLAKKHLQEPHAVQQQLRLPAR
jgi:hypothetical protein